jgi:hypothetical protein
LTWLLRALIVPALLAIAYSALPSHADECAIPGAQLISIEIETSPVTIDQSLSREALTEKDRENIPDGVWALGTTESNLSRRLGSSPATKPDGQGKFCTVIVSASFFATWDTTVRLASNLKPGSCMYDVIAKHEQKHVAVIQHYQAKLENRMRRAIQTAIANPIISPTTEQGIETARQTLSKVVNGELDAMAAELNRDQALLESSEEDAEARKLCGDAAFNAAFAN